MTVYQDKDEVKATQKTRLNARISVHIELRVPLLPRQERVSRSNNRRSRIDLAHDACFSHRNRLLLHRLVNRSFVLVLNYAKFIDGAYPAVSKDQSTCLKDVLCAILEGCHSQAS